MSRSAEAALASTRTTLAEVTAERDKLRRAYEQLKEQLELAATAHLRCKGRARRRDAVADGVRRDPGEAFDALAKQIRRRAGSFAWPGNATSDPARPPSSGAKPRPKPTGRRNLAAEDLPEERIEILDPALEGKAERIGFEESFQA